jgi:excisionase family DNA binding protein
VAYSQEAVDLFDHAAQIAKSSGDTGVSVNHLLAAFAAEEGGLMGELKHAHGITSASWRAAVARIGAGESNGPKLPTGSEKQGAREYLTPEEAAGALGIHVQTMRAYIRSERLPAFRLAGERAIRILRTDLEKVLEPLGGEKKEE